MPTAIGIRKSATGIHGLDEITGGGLPSGRPTLVCGPAGSGKTLLAIEFIVRGATGFGEPGVFLSFEERTTELADNVAPLGFDIPALIRKKKIIVRHVRIERSDIQETGEYDLEGLFIRLASAIDEIGAKRVALDGIEALFAGLPNEAILRAELRRLFQWLKDKRVTAVITGEQGEKTLTRHGLEEYVSDCVIFLDHRLTNQVATRRLRIVKYRGSVHGTNEYPTLIDETGLSVLPISSLGLIYPVSRARVSSGVPGLDAMLGGKGYFKGSSVLVSGTAGTGKTSTAAAFAHGICSAGGRCLYWSSEESPDQIIRNMGSIGIPLADHVRRGRLRFHATRPTLYGLESHLVGLHKTVTDFRPTAVVMDPITNLSAVGNDAEIKDMLTRVIDFLKNRAITAVLTSLSSAAGTVERSEVGISSLVDTWISLGMVQSAGERARVLYLIKSRGMAHSGQIRTFVLSRKGITLDAAYHGPGLVHSTVAHHRAVASDNQELFPPEPTATHPQHWMGSERRSLPARIADLQSQLAGLIADLKLDTRVENRRGPAGRRDRSKVDRRPREQLK